MPHQPNARNASPVCSANGRSFFAPLHQAAGGGFPGDTQGPPSGNSCGPRRNQRHAAPPAQSAVCQGRRTLSPPSCATAARLAEFLRRFRARTGGSHAAKALVVFL